MIFKTEDDQKVKENEIRNATKELTEALHKIDKKKIIELDKEAEIKYLNSKLSKDYLVFPKKYSAKQIGKFSASLTDEIVDETLGEYTGNFLDFLIEQSPDSHHLIQLGQLHSSFLRVGLYNQKSITIQGNVGANVGYGMERGRLRIGGDAGVNLGSHMIGGELQVTGNVGSNVGIEMKGGTILINGEIKKISQFILGGDIYHNGKQIVQNGEILDEAYIK